MRWLVLIAFICLLPQLATADCREEALAARTRAVNAGPMQFETLSWNSRYTQRRCGQIDGDRAEHDRGCGGSDGGAPESIRIGDQLWQKDEFGWVGPYGTVPDATLPEFAFPFQIIGTRCLGQSRIDGAELKTYEFTIRRSEHHQFETLFVDAVTGAPVRYDMRPEWRDGVGTQTTYRSDPAIRIAAPVVDPAERRAVSLQRFSDAVLRSDPACRRELIGIVRRGEAAAFEFRIASALYASPILTGVLAPSRSIHYRNHIVTNHEGRFELIAIGGNIWSRSEPRGWVPDGGRVLDEVLDILIPSTDRIGAVACLGPADVDGRSYSIYEYESYVDEHSVRKRDVMRRVFVDDATQLPARIEHLKVGEPWTETRRYDATLSVKPPIIGMPAQPPPK